MTDEREFLPEDDGIQAETDDLPSAPETDEFALLSEDQFEDALHALEGFTGELPTDEADAETDEKAGDEADAEVFESFESEEDMVEEEGADQTIASAETNLTAIDEDERLRLPRAQLFRRRLRNQVNMLPLALYLLALGGYLIARQQKVEGLPDFSTLAIVGISVLVFAFTTLFRALLTGRQERGLLLIGVWVLITGGMVFGLVYGIDKQADAQEWWPLLLWSLGATFIFVYPIERTHDTRLLWLGIITLVAGGVAYAVTGDYVDEQSFTDAVDYWPLLLTVAGIGLLPLVFRRRIGQ